MNQLAPNQTNLPAHLQRLAGGRVASAALGGLNAGSPPHVSIRNGRFTLIDAAGNKKVLDTFHLDCVIVDANPNQSKVYYAGAFDPTAEDFAPPDCFSDNGIGASAQAVKPQSTSCAQCPMNVWGSDTSRVTGKATKACNDVKKIAVITPVMPDMVFLLRVPPASLKILAAYIRTIAGNNADVTMVTTRITFDPQTQGVLNFAATGWIDVATGDRVAVLSDGKATADLLGMNDRPWTGQVPAAAVASPAQATQLAPPPPPPAQQPFTGGFAPPPAPGFQQPPAPAATAPSSAPAFMQGSGAQFSNNGQTAPTAASPTSAPRKRRTKAEMDAARAQQAGVGQQVLPQGASPFAPAPQAAQQPVQTAAVNIDQPVDIPAFLRGPQAQPAPQQQYGMVQQAPAPDAGLQAALAAAFNLPTT